MEEAIKELKDHITELFANLEQKVNNLEQKLEKKPTPKKTPKKTPTKPLSLEKAYELHVEGLKNPETYKPLCTYVKKSGTGAGLTSGLPATHILTGDDPNKRVAIPLPAENPAAAIIEHFGSDPRTSFAYMRASKNKNVCLNDSISKSVEFVGTLDNGVVVHAEETMPSEESIAASLSGKPMSPEKSKLKTPEDMSVTLPVVEESTPSENDNADLEQLLSSLN